MQNIFNINEGRLILSINQIIRNIGFSILTLFIPIYLLTIGFSINQVLLYFLFEAISIILFSPLSLIFSKKFGYKYILLFNLILVLIWLIFLNLIPIIRNSIYLIAIIAGIEIAFYYLPLNSSIARNAKKEENKNHFDKYNAFSRLSYLIGPIFGGIIFLNMGFDILIYITMFFLILSALPILYLKNHLPNHNISIKRVYQLYKTHKNYFFACIFNNIFLYAEAIIWPIYLFYNLKFTIINIGFSGALFGFGSIIFSLIFENLDKKRDKYIFLKIGGILYILIWISRIYFTSSISAYLLSTLAGLATAMIAIPFIGITYSKAEEEDIEDFLFFKEIPVFIGRIILLITIIFLADKFIIAFVLSALATLGFVLMKLRK
ncbi:MAG: MFS transporter [Candidatus Pacearchaeota archaeon]|jgi:MFS family permease